jgi:anti-sigma regulatory factor (Ser/Thr protein kinase)
MKKSFAGDLQAPAAARRWVTSALSGVTRSDYGDRPEDLDLVTSELDTNSVRAGARVIDVELVAARDGVELHVTDDAPGWPEARQPDWDDAHGRGLAIVADIADHWHTTGLRSGKRVTVTWSRTTNGDVVGHMR